MSGFFNWFKSQEQTSNPSKQDARRPMDRDWTEALVANEALTKGLYHGSYPGMKLASAMAFTPIAVPVWFMGLPIPTTEDDAQQLLLDQYVARYARAMAQIHVQCHREGTIWVWPHYSAKKQVVVWEFIPDDVVTDVVRDLSTGDIIKLITDEQIKVSVDYQKTTEAKRRRTFTTEKIEEMWTQVSGELPKGLRDQSYRNPLGSIPVPFANNQDGDEVRGHSDYERVLSVLKDYHDITLKQSMMLAKFEPKMVKRVKNLKEWLANNGYDSIHDIDIANIDLIIEVGTKEQESTEFVWPGGAHEAYDAALKTRFRMLVEGSGIPEILWGTKVEGNRASAEEQMDNLVKFVEEKRGQKVDGYKALFSETLALEAGARMSGERAEVSISWNTLDSISESTKSTIFSQFASGMSALFGASAITKDQAFRLWKKLYPDATVNDYKKYVIGLGETAKLKAFGATPYETIIDLEGAEDDADFETEERTINRRMNYSADQPRDEDGKFGEGGSGGGGKNKGASSTNDLAKEHSEGGSIKTFLPKEQRALKDYTEEAYMDTNDYLRGLITEDQLSGSDYNVKGTIKMMDQAFENAPVLGADVELYRGMGEFQTFNLGDAIIDNGYLSTSFDSNTSGNFAYNAENPTLFKISVPKGTPYITTGGEKEVLLQRGRKIKITKVTKNVDLSSDARPYKGQLIEAILE